MGKFLSAKWTRADDDALEHFQPETLFQTATFDASTAAGFVLENAPPLYSDVEELAQAMETLSDAMHVAELGKAHYGSGASSLSTKVIESLVSRAVADSNKHPAPRTFRPITKPSAFVVGQAVRARMDHVIDCAQYVTDMSDAPPAPHVAWRSPRTAETWLHVQPYLDMIVPSWGGQRAFSHGGPGSNARFRSSSAPDAADAARLDALASYLVSDEARGGKLSPAAARTADVVEDESDPIADD